MNSADLTNEQRTKLDAIMRRAEQKGFERVKIRVVNDPDRLFDGKHQAMLELEGHLGPKRYEAMNAFDPSDAVSLGLAIGMLAVAVDNFGEG